LGSIGPPHSHTSFLFGCIGGPAEGNNNHAFQQPDPTTRTWGQTIGRTRRPEDLSLSKRKRRPEDLSLKKKRRPEEDTHGGGALFCSAPSPLQAPPSLPLFPHRPQQFSAAYSFASKFRGAARGEGARRHDDAGGWSTATSWCSRPWSAW
jgi:hypothetical protein